MVREYPAKVGGSTECVYREEVWTWELEGVEIGGALIGGEVTMLAVGDKPAGTATLGPGILAILGSRLMPRLPLYGTAGGTTVYGISRACSALMPLYQRSGRPLSGYGSMEYGSKESDFVKLSVLLTRRLLHHNKAAMTMQTTAIAAMIGPTMIPTLFFLAEAVAAFTDCEGPVIVEDDDEGISTELGGSGMSSGRIPLRKNHPTLTNSQALCPCHWPRTP